MVIFLSLLSKSESVKDKGNWFCIIKKQIKYWFQLPLLPLQFLNAFVWRRFPVFYESPKQYNSKTFIKVTRKMINNFFRSWLLNKKFTFSVKPWRVFNSWSCSRPRAEREKILGFFNHGFWNRSTNTCPILQHNKTRSANYKQSIPFISLNKYTCKPPLRNQNPQPARSFSFPSQRLQQRKNN